jgi:RNA polymerase sigma factor (sigma-70 family)
MIDSQPSASLVTTRWSMVLAAGQSASPDAQKALAALCQIYWPAVYVFVRRQVGDVHDAQDLTQAFFAQMLEKNAFAVAQPERGRFRAFLLTSVKHFLHNEWDKQHAQKRGGGQKIIPLDFQAHDSKCSFEPADTTTPERLFERQWAFALLDGVMAQLRNEYVRAGKEPLFDGLKGTLHRSDADDSHAHVAERLGISENAAKVAAHRLRKRYRELLRAEVAQTLHDPQEIDDEIRQLFAAVRG